jgi:hypothetical protein
VIRVPPISFSLTWSPNNISWSVQVTQCSTVSHHVLPVRFSYILSLLFRQVWTSAGHMTVRCTILKLFDTREERSQCWIPAADAGWALHSGKLKKWPRASLRTCIERSTCQGDVSEARSNGLWRLCETVNGHVGVGRRGAYPCVLHFQGFKWKQFLLGTH